MNGIKLLLLLVASAQVEAGTERDYGWAVNKDDGVLEYIVQINPDKKRAMEQRSVQFPNGQENVSNMPRELVGRASRVVIRFGTEVLPREPSLQELERTQRLFEQPNASAAAMLGEGQLRDIESPVRNIQGQGLAPAFPALPNGLAGAQGQAGGFSDQVGQPANSLRNEFSERLSDALPDSSLPGPNMLAQNMANQAGGASAFLNEARGATGAGSKFNSTAQPANSPLSPVANLQTNSPARLPDFPATANANSPFASANQASINGANSRNNGLGSELGVGNTTTPLYSADRLNPPSLNTQMSLPQQRTPSSTFGTSPGLASQASSEWNNSLNPTAPGYSPSMSQPQDNYNFGGAPNYPPNYTSTQNLGEAQNSTHTAMNNAPYNTSNNSNSTTPRKQTNGVSPLSPNQMEVALAVRDKFDKNKDGQLTPDEYTPANVDGILLTLFVVSLLVNLYLGHLIRKLLMRYRLVLTNVRSQAAYT